MAVLQLVARFPLPAGPRPEAAWRLEACGDRPPRAAIVALAQTSGADRDHEPPWPTPTGLAAELQSRPGRIVETWLAWAQEPPTESPAGLAT
ncbi:MAG: hypothetical protein RLZZ440_1908, partial [Planctomycetota bacterium]